MDKNSGQSLAKGMAWMTFANISSRILAAIYIIPWYGWFGVSKLQANAMYTKGFTIYSVFLMLSTIGIPAAISKQVASYNAIGQYKMSFRLYKVAFWFMLFVGLIMGLIMWLISPFLSVGDKNMVTIYRSLSLAVVIMPAMSVSRGFFQGNQDMMPSAISQFMEQLVRILYMLSATFIILKTLHLNYRIAVVHSTFASFIGALSGLSILGIIALKRRHVFRDLKKNDKSNNLKNGWKLIYELIGQAIPFAFVGIVTSLYAVIDQYSFPFIMKRVTNYNMDQINSIYSLFAGNANKLVMIVISLGTAMASATIPLLSEAITVGKKNELDTQIRSAVKLLMFIVFPSAIGMATVAKQLYIIFYGYSSYNSYGICILIISALLSVFQALFLLLVDMIQGLYKNKQAVIFSLYGIGVKLLVQIPFIYLFQGYGPIIATSVGMIFSIFFGFRFLSREFDLNYKKMFLENFKLLIFSLIMGLVLTMLNIILNNIITQTLLIYVFELIVFVLVGILIYGFLIIKFGIMDNLIGSKIERIKVKFKR